MWKCILILNTVFLMMILGATAMNSSSSKLDVITDGGGSIANSTNAQVKIAVLPYSGNMSSASYNGYIGIFFGHREVPNITLNSPDDELQLNPSPNLESVDFNYTATDLHNLSACELFIDGTIKDRQINPQNGTSYKTTISFIPADLDWHVKCNDTSNNIGISETRHIRLAGGSPGGGGSIIGVPGAANVTNVTIKEKIKKAIEEITPKRNLWWIWICLVIVFLLFVVLVRRRRVIRRKEAESGQE